MGILKINYHMHSQYSIDGEMSIEEACEKAIELGLKEIAFTDHLDIDWPDPNYEFGALDIEKYLIDIEKNRERYKDCLKIKTGIEVGLQPHVLEEVEDIIVTYPFDFVIASIHIIQRMDPYQGDYYKNRTKEECYRLYYEETLELVKEFSNFDVLDHLVEQRITEIKQKARSARNHTTIPYKIKRYMLASLLFLGLSLLFRKYFLFYFVLSILFSVLGLINQVLYGNHKEYDSKSP
jgi:HisJ family histidinol phosphate phosphatase